MRLFLKTTLILVFCIGSVGFVLISDDHLIEKNHIWFDQEGYYVYLPALFIYSGFQDVPVRTHKVFEYSDDKGEKHVYTKYTYGVALMQTPFFLIAHVFQKVFSPLEATGYTMLYSQMIWFSALAYVLCGLWLLYRLLARKWNKQLALLSVCLTFLGTNLLYYTIGEPGMSHAYSFFLFVALLSITEQQLKNPERKWLLFWIIVVLAIITLIRPVNLVIACYPVIRLWKAHMSRLFRNSIYLINGLLVILILFVMQLALWKNMTGTWTYYSYIHEPGFIYWNNPKLINTLFSYENGWFIYTPMAILMIVGLILGIRNHRNQFLPILIIIAIIWYISSSWWKWNFGMAFGYRPFVEYYAFLALPLTYLIDRIYRVESSLLKIVFSIAILLFVFTNIGMCDRYSAPWEGENWNWDQYLDVLKRIFTFT